MLSLDAAITVTLARLDGRVAAVRVGSTRRTDAARLLAGRDGATVTPLLPTVFALCGTAQAAAGMAAIEAATHTRAAPAQLIARNVLLLAETAAEHAVGMLRDAPALLGEPADLGAAKGVRPALAALRKALYPDGDWHRPGGGRLAPHTDDAAQALSRLQAAADAAQPLAERLARRIEADGLAGLGGAPCPFMPHGGPPDLDARLAADDGAYVARPSHGGVVYETGPLARHPEFGKGVGARLAARMAELDITLHEAALLMHDCANHPAAPAPVGSGTGLGRADAARGLLVHRVEVEQGRVTRYQILAPTEWNFHPDGPLVRGLAGSAADEGLEWRAGLLAMALDP
ncbi:MAG: nickel-dependent hydrogenase large subunit, partial [Actinomycetota bacterium]